MSGWVCHWKPFWIPVGDSWKKALREEWFFIGDEHADEQAPIDDHVFESTDYSNCILGATRISFLSGRVPCETTTFGNGWRHHCTYCGHGPNATSYIRNSSVPFPNVWYCHFRAMISCQATRILSPQDRITLLLWVKISPHEFSVGHVVDTHKVVAHFRDAFEGKQSSSSQTWRQQLLFFSITCAEEAQHLQLERRRGRQDAFVKQLAEKWHIVTVQEASDYVDHDILQERFHVTHHAGCAIQQGHLLHLHQRQTCLF